MKSKINILKAEHGDSILIETFDCEQKSSIILIDGGTKSTYKTELFKKLSVYKKIDLIILTHIDEDHIGGLIELVKSSLFEKIEVTSILINAPNLIPITQGSQINYSHGTDLEKLLNKKKPTLKIFTNIASDNKHDFLLPNGIEINVFSPNSIILKQLFEDWPNIQLSAKSENTQISSNNLLTAKEWDTDLQDLANEKESTKSIKSDIFNASSFAFSLKTNDFNILLLGDSHPEVVIESLKNKYSDFPINFDLIKLSHHGSKNNISTELLNYVQSEKFIISTNGGKGRAKHPDRKTIGKIVCHKNRTDKTIEFYLNYELIQIETKTGKLLRENEEEKYKFKLITKNIIE